MSWSGPGFDFSIDGSPLINHLVWCDNVYLVATSAEQFATMVQELNKCHVQASLGLEANFTDTPDWPILLSNLLEQCRDSRPGLRRVNSRGTEAVRFQLEREVAEGTDLLRLEGGERPRKVARARVVEIVGLARPAFYSVHDQDRQLARFAVNFQDIDESTLVSLVAGKRPPVIQAQVGGFETDSPYTWLILLAILVVIGLALGDWQVLRR